MGGEQLLLVACDGIWDVKMVRDTGKLAKLLAARKKLEAAAEKLDHAALVTPEKKVRVMEIPKGLPKAACRSSGLPYGDRCWHPTVLLPWRVPE